jgi:L-lactate dehydrogenase
MKISIIGAGSVGIGVIDALVLLDIGKEIVLYNKTINKAIGEVFDLEDALPLLNGNMELKATDQLEDLKGSDIIVITIGAKQHIGESRLDLLKINAIIIRELMEKLDVIDLESKIIIVSNPVDVLTRIALETTKRDKAKVFGSGTVLDTMRLKEELGLRININRKNIHAFVVGEHGDSEFILWSVANIGPIRIKQMGIENFEQMKIDVLEKVKNRAYSIIEKKGFTKQAIGVAVAKIIKAILSDEKKIFTLSTTLTHSCNNLYSEVAISQPCILGKNGIEKTLLLDCDLEEIRLLGTSVKKLDDAYLALKK